MTKEKDEWGNIPLPGVTDNDLYNKKWAQVYALKGKKRPDQSAKMKENNPMKGKVSPNKGKSMPQISEKVKGKKKPEGHGKNVSEARKKLNLSNTWAGKERPEQSELMKDPTRNKGAQTMRETLKCPHCGKVANIPNYKRWHGDNCKHGPK